MTNKIEMTNENEMVNFSDMVRRRLNMQSQYASRYVDGRHGSPNLGHDLRFNGSPADYHSLTIHRDDVEKFVARMAGRL